MAGKAVAVDMGSHTTKVLELRDGKTGLKVMRFAAFPTEEADEELLQSGIPLKAAVVGLAGRDMTLRYTQVPPSPDWQLRNLMDLEIDELSSQSGDQLSADYNLLPVLGEEQDSETVLMALARNEALESVSETLQESGGSVAAHVPNCVAIYNAFLRAGPVDEDAVVCLANLGHQTMDIALVRGMDLLFARNLSGGGKVLDDAIAGAFNVSSRKAEVLKRDLLDLDPQSRGRFASGQAEKVTMAAGGSANVLVSAIQSSLAFCKTQTGIEDLQLDKVLISGGSAKIRGLKGLLQEALNCPVQAFNPLAMLDLTSLPADEAELLRVMAPESVVALGLAATAVDDSLYSLEILPDAVRRKQRFWRQSIFNILAAAVLLGLLVMHGMHAKEERDNKRIRSATLQRQASRINKLHEDVEQRVAANSQNRQLLQLLATRAVPLDGSLQVMRALESSLPDEFWIDSIQVVNRSRSGSSAHPMIQIEGRGKEFSGRGLSQVYEGFVKRLKAEPGVGLVTSEPSLERDAISFKINFDLMPGKDS